MPDPRGYVDEVRDHEPKAWGAPGRPPLFVILNLEGEQAIVDDDLRPLPRELRPAPGEQWLDASARYGAFAIWAARWGADVVALERDPDVFRLLETALYLNDVTNVIARNELGTAASIAYHGRNAVGLRLLSAPTGLVLPATVDKVVAEVPMRDAHRLASILAPRFEYVTAPGHDRAWRRARVLAWGRRLV